MLLVSFISLLGLSAVALAQDRPRLDQDEFINRSLVSAAVSVGIARECPTMEVRKLFGLIKAYELRNYARKLGYSNEEITQFIESRAQQERVKDWALEYVARQGANLDDPDTFCALGKYEIERKSLTGRLLRDLAPN